MRGPISSQHDKRQGGHAEGRCGDGVRGGDTGMWEGEGRDGRMDRSMRSILRITSRGHKLIAQVASSP